MQAGGNLTVKDHKCKNVLCMCRSVKYFIYGFSIALFTDNPEWEKL